MLRSNQLSYAGTVSGTEPSTSSGANRSRNGAGKGMRDRRPGNLDTMCGPAAHRRAPRDAGPAAGLELSS